MEQGSLKKLTANQKGSAILLVLALIGMLTGVGIMSVDRATTEIDLAYNQLQGDRAFYVAEAGLQRAIAELRNDDSWRDGYYRQVLDGGYYTTSIIDSTIDPALGDTLIIQSLGYFTKAVVNVELWVTPEILNPFAYALFSESGIAMRQGACTDSYNSDSGSYAVTVVAILGNIGTNATVTLSQDATVGGDVIVAVPGGISFGQSAQVLGDTITGADSLDLNIISDSEYVWAQTVNNASAGLSGTNYTYNSINNSLNVKGNGNVVLADGVYYFSQIDLKQNGQLDIAPGATVTIYLTGNLSLFQDATMNSGGAPSALIIFSKGAKFSMFQDSQFYGAFYGPSVVFKGRQDMGMYGSVVAGNITMFQDACFHYDRTLGSYTKGTTGEINVIAWRLQ